MLALFDVVSPQHTADVGVVFGVAVCFVGQELTPERVVFGRCRREEIVEVVRHGARCRLRSLV